MRCPEEDKEQDDVMAELEKLWTELGRTQELEGQELETKLPFEEKNFQWRAAFFGWLRSWLFIAVLPSCFCLSKIK